MIPAAKPCVANTSRGRVAGSPGSVRTRTRAIRELAIADRVRRRTVYDPGRRFVPTLQQNIEPAMWPYRSQNITNLLSTAEIELVLGLLSSSLGVPITLLQLEADVVESDVSDVKAPPDTPRLWNRIDPPRGVLERQIASYIVWFRNGRFSGRPAFAGAEDACRAAEERLALRVIEAAARGESSALRGKSPAGTIDVAVPIDLATTPVPVSEKRTPATAALIASGLIDNEAQRARLAKIVGKFGKLTQGEIRSLEEAGEPVEAEIRPADEKARSELEARIPNVPVVGDSLVEDLSAAARALASLALHHVDVEREKLHASLLADLFPRVPSPTAPERELASWLGRSVAALRRVSRASHLALFTIPPSRVDDEIVKPVLIAQDGLEGEAGVFADRAGTPFLEIDPAPFEPKPGMEPLTHAHTSASSLIGALKASRNAPAGWKDRLTKSSLVFGRATPTGTPCVVLFGQFASPVAPEPADLRFLTTAIDRLLGQYQIVVSESGRRRALGRLSRHEDPNAVPRPRGPLSPQRFDLRRLLDSMLGEASEPASAHGVSFDLRGLPDRAMVLADRTKLAHVIRLLIDYAVRNARREGPGASASILVAARPAPRVRGGWQITVDLLGAFLGKDERIRLLRSGTGAASREAPESDASKAAEESKAPPIDWVDAQRILGWHGGRLEAESQRTEEDPATHAWLGRTIFTATFREIEDPSSKPRPESRGHESRTRDDAARSNSERRDSSRRDSGRRDSPPRPPHSIRTGAAETRGPRAPARPPVTAHPQAEPDTEPPLAATDPDLRAVEAVPVTLRDPTPSAVPAEEAMPELPPAADGSTSSGPDARA
jgi:hypothetical protein